MVSRIRPLLLIVTAFWAYVAASNVLYANSMQANLTALHVAHQLRPAWRFSVPPALIHGLAYATLLGLGGIWIARLSGLLPSPP